MTIKSVPIDRFTPTHYTKRDMEMMKERLDNTDGEYGYELSGSTVFLWEIDDARHAKLPKWISTVVLPKPQRRAAKLEIYNHADGKYHVW